MPENYGCDHCEKTFTNRRHYDLHVDGHLRNICRVCGLSCNSRKMLVTHMSTVHGSKLDPVVLDCKYCMKTFVQKRSLYLHYKTVHKNTGTICLDCGQPFDSKQELADHVKTIKHGDGFICHKCGEVFTRSQQYKLHLQRHDAYCCFNCNAQFANSKKLNKHLKLCISIPPTDNYSKNKQSTAGIVYECVECKKAFEKKKYYKRHMKTVVHSTNKVDNPFYCAHCPKIFYYKFNLSSHMKQVHFKQYNNYICNLCGQSFQYANNYKRHKDSHMQVRNYVCEHCGACFYRKHALQDHLIAIHNEEKNFVCNVCGDNFKLKSILTRHMKNHSETKKYVCHCKRIFKFASNLRRHQINIHNQVFTESIKIKRFVEDISRSSPSAVMNEEKEIQRLKQKNINHLRLEDTVSYSLMAYPDNLDLSSVDIAESVLQVASASTYKMECEENSCFPGIHPPIETSLVCSLNDGVDLSPNSSQQYLSDYDVPHQFPFLNI